MKTILSTLIIFLAFFNFGQNKRTQIKILNNRLDSVFFIIEKQNNLNLQQANEINQLNGVLISLQHDLKKTQDSIKLLNNQLQGHIKPVDHNTKNQKNPFGTGGDAVGGRGIGSGPGPFGDGRGNDGQGSGGSASGKGRIRLNEPKVDHIETNVKVTVSLKLTINEDGQVISAQSTSKTTTTDKRIIDQVISAVKDQVRYNKDPGAGLVSVFLTVRINAT
jgi:hypothetical protein